jgi:hypothetical protein
MFTVEEAANHLALSLPRAKALVRLCKRTLPPDNFASVKKQFSRWHNWPGFPEKVLWAANERVKIFQALPCTPMTVILPWHHSCFSCPCDQEILTRSILSLTPNASWSGARSLVRNCGPWHTNWKRVQKI